MPPTGDVRDLKSIISEYISKNKVVVFSKTTCQYCDKVKNLFRSLSVEFLTVELDQLNNGEGMQQSLASMYGQKTVPLIILSGQHIGGCDDALKMHSEGRLLAMLMGEVGMVEEVPEGDYDYDLIVIGGGSGGLACAKEASSLNKKVACLDFVKPTPRGTTWGLGGTCVNVGCIPKKLMHQAGLLGHGLKDAKAFGWNVTDETIKHDWMTMRNAIQMYIKSLNWGYKTQLKTKKVTYENAYGSFVGAHKIKCIDKKGQEKELTSRYFVVATGGRPKLPDIPGCKEYCLSSDDLFSLPYNPGKTLTIGASYVSLECAGFLNSLGLEVVVMVRSILLRGFDQQMAELVGSYMEKQGVKFVRPCVPTKIEKLQDGTPGLYRVSGVMQDTMQPWSDTFNTVLMAVGRDPCTAELNLNSVGVKVNQRSGYVLCDSKESTSCPHIYAVGDIVEGRPELTPVAIQAGKLLARRLFAGGKELCDYTNIPTTVFTPLEYGCIGLTEEDARAKYGDNDIKVYHSNFTPLEWQVPHHDSNACYAKVICVKSLNERVVGLHVLGPNAGEITQGWAVGIKLKATKHDFDNTIGIHPTCAEVFTTLNVSKESGQSAQVEGC